MAGQERTTTRPLSWIADLESEPYRFQFFAAMRILECVYADQPRLGTAARPADESVRLGQQPSLIFAPSSLASFRRGGPGRPDRLDVYPFGLFGPNGPLPLHLTDFARDRARNSNDDTFARFVDIFHHRALSLFYRAWAQAQPTVEHDRPETDRFAAYIGALIGIGMPALRNRDALPDLAKLHFAGHLSSETRNPDGLSALLSGYFKVPVEIQEFVGQWVELPIGAITRLGESTATGLLGQSTIVGSRVWECQQKFRIRIGPLGFDAYRRFLPGNDALIKLRAAVRNYVGDELDWDVQVALRKEEVPALRLGQQGRLGWTTWLCNRPPAEDVADLLLN